MALLPAVAIVVAIQSSIGEHKLTGGGKPSLLLHSLSPI